MASPQCNAHSESPMVEQIITEFFAKSLHIILESRSPFVSSRNYYSGDPSTSSPSSSSSTSSIRPRDKWFNLALGDCPAALENMDLWGVGESNFEPLVIDVILIRKPSELDRACPPPGECLVKNISVKDQYPNHWSTGQEEMVPERSEKIIERWVVQYESRKIAGGTGREPSPCAKKSGNGSSHASEMSAAQKKLYKRSIILLRSLYVTVKLLPAYKVFRDLSSSGQIRPFSLVHRISSFVEPFTRVEDAEMKQFAFVPVETPCGRLCLSVSYLPTLEDLSSESSTPLSAQLITDYVGSPLAEPLKRFESLPSSAPIPTYVSFTRRHSWSNSHRVPSVSPSPSPTRSDSRALCHNLNPDGLLSGQTTVDNSSMKSLVAHKGTTSFGECYPSPPVLPSASPSPSPPHFLGRNSLNSLMRTESAPERILVAPRSCLVNDALLPSPSPKGTRFRSSSQADSTRVQAPVASTSQPSLPDCKSQSKPEIKVLSPGKADASFLHGGAATLCTSPSLPITINSGRLSMDEFENSGIFCPFVEDEDFRTDHFEGRGQLPEEFESGRFLPVRKSKGAAVGELVIMLKSAPPLRQDSSKLEPYSHPSGDDTLERGLADKGPESPVNPQNMHSDSGVMGLSLLRSRTTSDALQELRKYREMKDLLLRQGGCQLSDFMKPANSSVDDSS